jgi:hypothetical protein
MVVACYTQEAAVIGDHQHRMLNAGVIHGERSLSWLGSFVLPRLFFLLRRILVGC